jgi:ribosomal protein L11 methyltransferase
MRNTVQIAIAANEQLREQLVAQLFEIDFDGFEETEDELLAFIDEALFDQSILEGLLSRYQLKYEKSVIKDQNWNAVWESNFLPVVVDGFCAVRAHFHEPIKDIANEIIITPKMSFGTGHHATTFLMISEMSKLDFKNKRVADFGTGTGILAILANNLGTENVWAIDIDDWSIENAKENIEKNGCENVIIEKKDRFETEEKFDIILANINRNVILGNVDGLTSALKRTGKLLLSGLLVQDEKDVVAAFTQRGFSHKHTVERNKWICLLLEYELKL